MENIKVVNDAREIGGIINPDHLARIRVASDCQQYSDQYIISLACSNRPMLRFILNKTPVCLHREERPSEFK